MPDYQNGKIYKLVNDVDDQIYVGSTTQSLAKRKWAHLKCAQSEKNQSRRVYQHFNEIGWDHIHIILIENYACQSKEELLSRERYWFELLKPSLNQVIPFRDKTEKKIVKKNYTEKNSEKIRTYNMKYKAKNADACRAYSKEYNKTYRINHADELREKACAPTFCPVCSSYVSKHDFPRHTRTQKHIKNFDKDPINYIPILFS